MVGAAVFRRRLNDLRIECCPHRFRSSFRSWCSDLGDRPELAEQALAHTAGSQAEVACARSDRAAAARGHGGPGSPSGWLVNGQVGMASAVSSVSLLETPEIVLRQNPDLLPLPDQLLCSTVLAALAVPPQLALVLRAHD